MSFRAYQRNFSAILREKNFTLKSAKTTRNPAEYLSALISEISAQFCERKISR